jgi:hypothetical protein
MPVVISTLVRPVEEIALLLLTELGESEAVGMVTSPELRTWLECVLNVEDASSDEASENVESCESKVRLVDPSDIVLLPLREADGRGFVCRLSGSIELVDFGSRGESDEAYSAETSEELYCSVRSVDRLDSDHRLTIDKMDCNADVAAVWDRSMETLWVFSMDADKDNVPKTELL